VEWLPAAVAGGGPWALLGTVILTVVGLLLKGILVPGPQVDRIVKAYETVIAAKTDDVTAWKTAHALEVEANKVLREQNGKLLEHSATSAQAWRAIKAAAESRADDVPT
jgi:hypothetical protein